MAYDQGLAGRIRSATGARGDVTERRMFGGLAFLHRGKLFCGVVGEDLMVRVGPDRYVESLAARHVRPMDFTGRPMKGYVFVGPAGARTSKAVRTWVDRGLAAVRASAAGGKEPGRRAAAAKTSARGLRRPRQPMDASVKAALERHRLVDAYRARPPYQQNDYLGWIRRARRPETKEQRLGQMLDELKRGDRYMKMAWHGPRRR